MGPASLVLQMILKVIVLSDLVLDHPAELLLSLFFEPLSDPSFHHFSELNLGFKSEPTEPGGLNLRVRPII